MARMVTAWATRSTTSTTPPKASKSNGLSSGWYRSGDGLGATVTASRKATGTAALIRAHQRQRAEGSDPVGVSSRTRARQASAATANGG
jgi:hypothetical protein